MEKNLNLPPPLDDKNPKNNSGGTPLYFAAGNGHLKICQLILANVEEKNLPDSLGNTPLHVAAKSGHLEVCRAIIGTLDDKNPRNDNGITPFSMAAQQGHLEICKFIVNQMEAKEKLWKNLTVVTSMFLAGGLTGAFVVYMILK